MAMNMAAAAGGVAARVAMDRLANWWSSPGGSYSGGAAYNMGPLRQALPPSNARARGRGGRRGRGRGRGRGRRGGGEPGVNTRGGAKIVIRDTEIIGEVSQGLKYYQFNPSPEEMPRLKAYEQMYGRYRFKYVNIAYKSGSGTATAGNIGMGILVGPYNKVVTAEKISKLRPYLFTPAWKNGSLTVGADIDPSKWMVCGDNTVDGTAFTLYINASAASIGVVQVSYEIEFDQPKPF